ncbi:hypothetical protein [Vibrio diazotrophicus]|uniref:hypothetical protein n=1 Tax=Vibrio diazotrophicus TaxID=685 RepID=UPI0012E0AD19|nr:hypothetical protein [Vibrio diazotrophicus]
MSVIAGYSDEQALKVIANYFLFFSAILFCISVAIVKLTETDIVILKNLSVALFYFYVSVYLWSKDRKRIVQGILGDLKKLSKRIVFWSIFLAVAFYLYDVLQNEIPITEEDIKTSLMPTIILLLILGSQSFFLHKAFS